MLTITALGDSTTWGYNSGEKVEQNMVTTAQQELSKKLGQQVDIINRGQNSTTIGDAIANGNLYAAANDPSNVVVLNFGMNEAYRRVDPAEFRQNILDAAGYLQSLGKTVVLQTPNFTSNPDIPNVETYANVVRDVAGQYGLTLDDKYAATESAEFSQNDLTHPTAQVYQQLGKSLADALAPVVAPEQKRTIGSVSETEARAGETGLLADTGVSQGIIDRLNAIPSNEFETVGFQEGGKDYSMDPNGLVSVRDVGAKPNDQVQVFDQGGNFLASHAVEQRSDFVQAINQAGRVGIPAVIGAAILGPAGMGLLNAPAAAAVGSGGSTLLHGGSVEDALKAAALAGLTAYGLDYLTTTPELAQARQLAASGMGEEAIADALIQSGVKPSVAIEAASNATGLPAAGANRGLEFASTGAAPDVIVTGGSAVAPGVSAVAPAVAAAFPVTSAATPGLLNQQVQVQSQTGGTQQTALPAVVPGLVSVAPTQGVTVTGQTLPTSQTNVAPAVTAGLLAPTQTVPVTTQTGATTQQQNAAAAAGLVTPATQRVETIGQRQVPVEDRPIPTLTMAPTIPVKATEAVTVEGKKEPVPTAAALIPAGAAGAAGVTKPATPTSNITATDAALAALLLGGAGSLLNQSQSGGFTMDPNLANAIINAPRPVYGRGVSGYQMPGMFQIQPTDVYNPFATTAPFGAGRFGAVNQPITLPYGLMAGPTMGISSPVRGLV